MADYQFNTDLTPKVQGTNIADMINLARGIQGYQQAEQLNPLAVQKARMDIEQAQQMNPLAVQKSTEEVKQAKIGTESATTKLGGEKMQKFMDTVGARVTDQELLGAIQAKDKQKVKDLISGDIQELIKNKILTPAEAMQSGARMLDLADNNLDAVLPALKNLVTRAASSESRLGLQTGQIIKIGNVEYQYNPATGQTTQIGTAGGATSGATGGTQPQTKPPAKGQELFREDMPIVPGAVMQLNERQQARYTEGEKIQKDSNDQVKHANEMTQSIRKIRETIGSAAGSLTGQALRNALKSAVGSAEYETLTKNLEDLYVRNTEAMGGNTDAARESIRKISGSADLTKEALEGIIDRVDASSHALKKFNQGFSNYAKNTSTENANIHARQFQQAWTQNADPLVFMAQTINASNKSKAEKQLMQQKLLKDLTDDQLADLKKKAKNIKLLEAGKRISEND
jgi:hypothetical protein